jgi:hypothetical protein
MHTEVRRLPPPRAILTEELSWHWILFVDIPTGS